MEFAEVVGKVEHSRQFVDWKQKNPGFYLAHGFLIMDNPSYDEWQIGYYSPEKHLVTTFVFTAENVAVIPDQKVLKEESIHELKLDAVKLGVNEAIAAAERCRKENYAKELPLKSFFIIQHSELGTLFNITFFTQSFNAVNVKVSASDGKILRHSCERLVEFS